MRCLKKWFASLTMFTEAIPSLLAFRNQGSQKLVKYAVSSSYPPPGNALREFLQPSGMGITTMWGRSSDPKCEIGSLQMGLNSRLIAYRCFSCPAGKKHYFSRAARLWIEEKQQEKVRSRRRKRQPAPSGKVGGTFSVTFFYFLVLLYWVKIRKAKSGWRKLCCLQNHAWWFSYLGSWEFHCITRTCLRL